MVGFTLKNWQAQTVPTFSMIYFVNSEVADHNKFIFTPANPANENFISYIFTSSFNHSTIAASIAPWFEPRSYLQYFIVYVEVDGQPTNTGNGYYGMMSYSNTNNAEPTQNDYVPGELGPIWVPFKARISSTHTNGGATLPELQNFLANPPLGAADTVETLLLSDFSPAVSSQTKFNFTVF